jgi:hypothetical protein
MVLAFRVYGCSADISSVNESATVVITPLHFEYKSVVWLLSHPYIHLDYRSVLLLL